MNASTVDVVIDNEIVSVSAGITVAAALLNVRARANRVSVSGEPRGPLCGMGVCHECRTTIDGVPHRRACMTLVQPGMVVTTPAATARAGNTP
jgi:predicted molibdopterin-dependent oxidoreductase YjgC